MASTDWLGISSRSALRSGMIRTPRHVVHGWGVPVHVEHRPVPSHRGQTAIRPQDAAARLARTYRDSADLAS
jgi:hypothetical protein